MICIDFVIMGAKVWRFADRDGHYAEKNVYHAEHFVYYAEKVCTRRKNRDGIGEKSVTLHANSKYSNEETHSDPCRIGVANRMLGQ